MPGWLGCRLSVVFPALSVAANLHDVLPRMPAWVHQVGGVQEQEDAPALGKPATWLRNTTERPELAALGRSRLVGVEPEALERQVDEPCMHPDAFARMAKPVVPYGDGHAADLIGKG
jgi:UDP-N-acetylglucosamine 2-epimerase